MGMLLVALAYVTGLLAFVAVKAVGGSAKSAKALFLCAIGPTLGVHAETATFIVSLILINAPCMSTLLAFATVANVMATYMTVNALGASTETFLLLSPLARALVIISPHPCNADTSSRAFINATKKYEGFICRLNLLLVPCMVFAVLILHRGLSSLHKAQLERRKA